jgi:hypothetical protein
MDIFWNCLTFKTDILLNWLCMFISDKAVWNSLKFEQLNVTFYWILRFRTPSPQYLVLEFADTRSCLNVLKKSLNFTLPDMYGFVLTGINGVTAKEGALRHIGIFGVGAPVSCCHCLTEIFILNIYRNVLENSVSVTITVSNTTNKNNFCFIWDGITKSVVDGGFII